MWRVRMSDQEPDVHRRAGEIILNMFGTGAQVQLRDVDGTVWLTQAQLAELHDTSVPNILQTIGRVLDDEEVGEAPVGSDLMVQQESARHVRREVKVHNLDMILAVGYRVTTVTPRSRGGSGRLRTASRSRGADKSRARREETERGRDGRCQ